MGTKVFESQLGIFTIDNLEDCWELKPIILTDHILPTILTTISCYMVGTMWKRKEIIKHGDSLNILKTFQKHLSKTAKTESIVQLFS